MPASYVYTSESVPALCTTENMPASYIYICKHYWKRASIIHYWKQSSITCIHYQKCASIMHYWKHARLHTTENVPVLNYWKHAWIMHNWKHASIIHYCQQVHSITTHAHTHTHFPVWCTVIDTHRTLELIANTVYNQPKLSGSHTLASFGFLVELGKTTGVFFLFLDHCSTDHLAEIVTVHLTVLVLNWAAHTFMNLFSETL